MPAQVLNTSDEEDAEVFGDDTPPPNLPEQREDQEPADVLFETIGTLWEEGNDLVVHMMEYYLSQQMRAGHEQDRQLNMDEAALAQRIAVLREARQVVRVYGVRQLCQLSPWWSNWLENLLRGWRPQGGDQIVMMMGLEQRHPRSVRDWLRGGASSGRASSSTSFTTASQEAEALRRWLNEFFEGDKADYWEDLEEMELDEVENPDEDPDGMVERLGGVEPTQLDDEENEGDDVDLGQKGKPKGGGTRRSRRSRTRSRSRSTEEGQRTWSTASASGWGRFPPGGTGSDKNNHRPWRRMTRTEVETEAGIDVLRRRAGNSATSSPNARPTASSLPSIGRQHAWACLMDMDNHTRSPDQWRCGLSDSSRENIRASFGDMDAEEREIMLIEFLQVMSAIFRDVTEALRLAMGDRNNEVRATETDNRRNARPTRREEEEDEFGLVQTGRPLTPTKTQKLIGASKPGTVEDLLGSALDRLVRSLLAAMERMKTEEARRTAQAIVMQLRLHCGWMTGVPEHGLPAVAEGLLSGMIAFGAEVNGEAMELPPQDEYFVQHWWKMMAKYIPAHTASASSAGSGPAGPAGSFNEGGSANAGGNVASVNDLVSATTGNEVREVDHEEHQGQGVMDVADRSFYGRLGGYEAGAPTIELNDTPVDDICQGEGKDDDDDEEEASVEDEAMPPVQCEAVPERPAKRKGPPLVTDVEKECIKWRAERYRDWEMWEMATSTSSWQPRERGRLRVVVRAAVQSEGGLRGPTQSLMLHVGETDSLALNVEFSAGTEISSEGQGYRNAAQSEDHH